MRWLAPMAAIGWRLALGIMINAFALSLPLTAVGLYVVRCLKRTAQCPWHIDELSAHTV